VFCVIVGGWLGGACGCLGVCACFVCVRVGVCACGWMCECVCELKGGEGQQCVGVCVGASV